MLWLTYAPYQDHDITSHVQDALTNDAQVIKTDLEKGSYAPPEDPI